MVRFILSILVALVVAFPSASHASFLPAGMDLMGPADCCCAAKAKEKTPPPPRFNAACCCELEKVPTQLAPSPPALLDDTHEHSGAAPVLVELSWLRAGLYIVQASLDGEWARGPPARASLFAQHTSLQI